MRRWAKWAGLVLLALSASATWTPGLASPAAHPDPAQYSPAGFDVLASFPYDRPGKDLAYGSPARGFKKVHQTIPVSIKALNGRKVRLTGYMIPLEMDGPDRVSGFALVRSRMSCCYGRMPEVNEWVWVELPKGKHTFSAMDIPLDVFGTLTVEELREVEGVMGMYRLTMDMMRQTPEGIVP